MKPESSKPKVSYSRDKRRGAGRKRNEKAKKQEYKWVGKKVSFYSQSM